MKRLMSLLLLAMIPLATIGVTSAYAQTVVNPNDSAYNLIYAVAVGVSTVSGVIVYILNRFHLTGALGTIQADIVTNATKLEGLGATVASHETQLKQGLALGSDLVPQLKTALQNHTDAINNAAQTITQKVNDIAALQATASSGAGSNPPTTKS